MIDVELFGEIVKLHFVVLKVVKARHRTVEDGKLDRKNLQLNNKMTNIKHVIDCFISSSRKNW